MGKFTYLHGFSAREQKRLIDQAEFLEPYVFQGVDLEFKENLLEVGCGVGAQTKIICRRFPKIKVVGLDLSENQLKVAAQFLKQEIKDKRVNLLNRNAEAPNIPANLMGKKFDSAFICWFLEHVPDPVKVLKGIRPYLKPGSKIYCTEIFNQALFMEPYSPAILKYWFEFNDWQWSNKGHPFMGALLGHVLNEAGYTDIQIDFKPFHFDSRQPNKRALFSEQFFKVLLSAEAELLKTKRVDKKLINQMHQEIEKVKKAKDAVFFDMFVRATARTPKK
jgi:ubiquinone/menaquinone biosynthesis C-methylase UbiE